MDTIPYVASLNGVKIIIKEGVLRQYRYVNRLIGKQLFVGKGQPGTIILKDKQIPQLFCFFKISASRGVQLASHIRSRLTFESKTYKVIIFIDG